MKARRSRPFLGGSRDLPGKVDQFESTAPKTLRECIAELLEDWALRQPFDERGERRSRLWIRRARRLRGDR